MSLGAVLVVGVHTGVAGAVVGAETCRGDLLVLARFEHGEEGFLWDFDLTKLPHPLFTLALFGPQFTLSGDVAAIAFCGDVFTQRRNGFASDDFPTDSSLNGDLKLMF